MNKGFYLNDSHTKLCEDEIWGFFFRIERKYFKKKKYTFNHQIATDGVRMFRVVNKKRALLIRLKERKLKYPQNHSIINLKNM